MGIFNFLLAEGATTTTWQEEIANFLDTYLVPITIVLLVMASIFCLVLTFMIMKTENPEDQKKYKKRMIQICITIAICLALVWLLKWLLGSGLFNYLDGIKSSVQDGLSKAGES